MNPDGSYHTYDKRHTFSMGGEKDLDNGKELLTGILAKKLGAKKVIVRVNTMENLSKESWRIYQDLGIDGLVSPEDIAAQEIINLLRQNVATEAHDFAGGKLELLMIKLESNAIVVGKTLEEVSEKYKHIDFRALAIDRRQKTFIPKHDDVFHEGDLPKAEVRRLAELHKLPSAHRHNSQGICFLGKINYNDYIKEYVGEKEGDIIELETGKKLGKHKGFWFHTIGQRKGLGLGGGPWFVVKKDTERNLIYVSKGYDPIAQYTNNIDLVDVMTMNPAIEFVDGQRVRYKIRHQPGFNLGNLKLTESGLTIISDESISGVAAGQFGVIYHETEPVVLGSGVIG